MSDTRARIVDKTAELFRRQGFHGTGLKQIVAEAEAPFGSLYHFFPGGKDELAAAVIRSAGSAYQELIENIFDAAPDLERGVRACFDGAALVLRETDYADACPIETVALEVASTNETLRQACAEVFTSWIAEATRRGVAGGLPRTRARELGLLMIAALEGAFVLSRTLRDPEAVEVAGRLLAELAPVKKQPRARRTAPVRRAARPRSKGSKTPRAAR